VPGECPSIPTEACTRAVAGGAVLRLALFTRLSLRITMEADGPAPRAASRFEARAAGGRNSGSGCPPLPSLFIFIPLAFRCSPPSPRPRNATSWKLFASTVPSCCGRRRWTGWGYHGQPTTRSLPYIENTGMITRPARSGARVHGIYMLCQKSRPKGIRCSPKTLFRVALCFFFCNHQKLTQPRTNPHPK